MGPGAQGEEPAALKVFYTTPAGPSVKVKKSALDIQMQKIMWSWIGGLMKKVETVANDFAKDQGVDPRRAASVSADAKVTTP